MSIYRDSSFRDFRSNHNDFSFVGTLEWIRAHIPELIQSELTAADLPPTVRLHISKVSPERLAAIVSFIKNEMPAHIRYELQQEGEITDPSKIRIEFTQVKDG